MTRPVPGSWAPLDSPKLVRRINVFDGSVQEMQLHGFWCWENHDYFPGLQKPGSPSGGIATDWDDIFPDDLPKVYNLMVMYT